MARPIDEFEVAWSALSGSDSSIGWRCIAVSPSGSCPVMAARRFPNNDEAILVGFTSDIAPPKDSLPNSIGFEVSREDPLGDSKTWIALSRKDSGSPEMFSEMVCDITGAMDSFSGDEEAVLRTMISRIRAWQEFMRNMMRGLSPEAELGLFGEMTVLGKLVDAGVSPAVAVQGWLGPVGGVQDFSIGVGAIEVKSTLSNNGFPAKIGSLEQLDNSLVSPLFLSGIRLVHKSSGCTIGELAERLMKLFSLEVGIASIFIDKLIAAGLPSTRYGEYTRRFFVDSIRLLEVDNTFPRFIANEIPCSIRKVQYELDLDMIHGYEVDIDYAIKKLGIV
jgi:hypothetical protein